MATGVTIKVRVTPRGGRDAVIGWRARDETLLVRVSAPPVAGAANRACIELLARVFGVKRGQVILTGGETSRTSDFCLPTLPTRHKIRGSKHCHLHDTIITFGR